MRTKYAGIGLSSTTRKNSSRFSRLVITNVPPPFYGSQCVYEEPSFPTGYFIQTQPGDIFHIFAYAVLCITLYSYEQLLPVALGLLYFCFCMVSFYLSHCYTIAWDRLSNQFFLSVYVCMYVCMCLWARLRSHFSTDLHEIW